MAVSIQVLSDLHLEQPQSYDIFEVPVVQPYLALLGDIGNIKHDGLFQFLKVQLQRFKVVFFLYGNHEPYDMSWEAAKKRVNDFCVEIKQRQASEGYGEFVLLDRTRYDVSEKITVLGCTLFSRILPEQAEHVSFGLQDFYSIDEWTTEKHNDAHSQDLAWLNEQVSLIAQSEPARVIVIFTHYNPSLALETTDPKHQGSRISSGFSTDLSKEVCWTSRNVKAWVFGHTHYNCDFVDEVTGKHVLTNQRGYYFAQADGFDEGKFVSL